MKKSLRKQKAKNPAQQTPKQRSVLANYLRAFLLASTIYYSGYYMGIMNPMGEILTRLVFRIETDQQANEFIGNCNLLLCIGAMVSFFFVGPAANKLGRVRLLILSELLGVCLGLGYAVQSIPVFYLMRTLTGVAVGFIGGVVPIALSELFPSEITGVAGCFAYFSSTSFTLVGWLTPYFFGNDKELIAENYRWIFVGPAVLGAAHLACLWVAFGFGALDSPAFFLQKLDRKSGVNEEEGVVKSVENWLGCVYKEDEVALIARNMIKRHKSQLAQNSAKSAEEGITALLGPRFRFRFFIAIALNITQQLTGINYLIFLSTQLFDKISNNGREMTLVIGAANLFGGVVGIFTISRLGRRFNMLSGLLTQILGFSLLFFGILNKIDQTAIYVAGVVLYMVSFAAGMGGTLGIYCAEIVPATAVGVSGSLKWLFASLVGKLLPGLNDSLGPPVLIQFFIGCMALTFVFVYFNCVETLGLGMEQVEAYYRGDKRVRKQKKE